MQILISVSCKTAGSFGFCVFFFPPTPPPQTRGTAKGLADQPETGFSEMQDAPCFLSALRCFLSLLLFFFPFSRLTPYA